MSIAPLQGVRGAALNMTACHAPRSLYLFSVSYLFILVSYLFYLRYLFIVLFLYYVFVLGGA